MSDIVHENREYLGKFDKPGQVPFFDAEAVEEFYDKINKDPESLWFDPAIYDEDEIVGLITMYALVGGVREQRLKKAGYLVDILRGATASQVVAGAFETGEVVGMAVAQALRRDAATVIRNAFSEGKVAPPSSPLKPADTRRNRRLATERKSPWITADKSEADANAEVLPTRKQLVQELDRKRLITGRAAVALYRMLDVYTSPEGETPALQEAIEGLNNLMVQLLYDERFKLTEGEHDTLKALLDHRSLLTQIRHSVSNGGPGTRYIQTNLLSALNKIVSLSPDQSVPAPSK